MVDDENLLEVFAWITPESGFSLSIAKRKVCNFSGPLNIVKLRGNLHHTFISGDHTGVYGMSKMSRQEKKTYFDHYFLGR